MMIKKITKSKKRVKMRRRKDWPRKRKNTTTRLNNHSIQASMIPKILARKIWLTISLVTVKRIKMMIKLINNWHFSKAKVQ